MLFLNCRLALLASLTGLISTPSWAVNVSDERKSISITRTNAPPVIDGRVGEDEWAQSTIVEDLHQTSPSDGGPPSMRTTVHISFDSEFLYIGAVMHDSEPASIRASQMIQGKLFFTDDRFFVMLDSFNSKRNDYFFQVNANGIRRDALRENNSQFIDDWSTIWLAESEINEAGWSTEIAIPFKSLSFDPGSDTWGINFGRGIMRNQEFLSWSSQDRQDWPAYAGEATGLTGLEQGRGLDIVPSMTLGQRREVTTGRTHSSFEPALDIRYRITPSLGATFTVNTDFSTAEVDDQQVALDRFSLFFPEKRDFFLEDAGIFEFGNIGNNGRPFFSRRIGRSNDGHPIGIVAGAKLTGRAGKFNIGALAIRQEAFADVGETDLVVARGSMYVQDESTVGFIATSGNPTSNDSNSVFGMDYLYRNSDGPFGQITTGNFWVQKSSSTGLTGDDLAFGARLEMPNDRVEAYLAAEEIQENFNPELGFVNRTGIRRYEAGLRIRTRPQTGRWRSIDRRFDFSEVTDTGGRTLSRFARLRPLFMQTHTGDFWLLDVQRNREVVRDAFNLFGNVNVSPGDYTYERVRIEGGTAMQRPVSLLISVQGGGFFGGDRLEKFVELQWRQSAHFSMALIYEEQDVDLPSGSFESHLASLRTDVAFNSRWSWSNLLQYNNTAEVFGINSRLRYIPQAGQEALLVLNHRADVDLDNRLHSTESELNLKASYTFRY